MVAILNVLLVDFCTQLALVFAAAVADEGICLHTMVLVGQMALRLHLHFESKRHASELKSDNQYSNNVHTVEC